MLKEVSRQEKNRKTHTLGKTNYKRCSPEKCSKLKRNENDYANKIKTVGWRNKFQTEEKI